MWSGASPFTTFADEHAIVFAFERALTVPAGAGRIFMSNDLVDGAEVSPAQGQVSVKNEGDREKVSIRFPLLQLPAVWRGRVFFRP